MNVRLLHSLIALLALPLALAAEGCSSSSSSSGTTSNGKNEGDGCTCDNPKADFGPQGPLAGCTGTGGGCFTFALGCYVNPPAPQGTPANGVCVKTCKTAEEGKQGSCAAGKTCTSSGGTLLCL